MKNYKILFIQLVFLFLGITCNNGHANEKIYEVGGLQYTFVKGRYLLGSDLYQSLSTRVFTQDYDPKKGTLIVTIESFYDSEKIDKPTDLSLYPMVSCMSKTCDDSALYNPRKKTHRNKAITTTVFEEDNRRFVKSLNKNLIANKRANQFTYKSMREPAKIYVSIDGSINKNEKDAYVVLVTSFYVTKTPSVFYKFLDSSKGVNFLKFLLIFVIFSCFSWHIYVENKFAPRPVLGIGIFLTFLGVINLLIWHHNYMVIGTSIIAISGVYVLFNQQASKYIYGVAILFLTVLIGIKFGWLSKVFFSKLTFLYIMLLAMCFLNISTEE